MGETNQDTEGRDTSQGQEGNTSEENPTFTREQVEKEVSDRLAKAGRDAKSLEKRQRELEAREAQIQAAMERISQWEKDRDAEEEERARSDPQALDYLQAKRALRKERDKLAEDRAALETEKAKHAERLERAEEVEREIMFWEVAQKYKVDPGDLKNTCLELEIATSEKAETIAKKMANTAAKQAELSKQSKPDSGKTMGGPESEEGLPAWKRFSNIFREQGK